MRRRDVLRLISAAPLVGCAAPPLDDADDTQEGQAEDMARKGVPPWHMWGVSQQFNIVLATPNAQITTSQLAKVSYRRPETFSFLVWCNIAQVKTVGANDTMVIDFDLIVGIGRSQVTIPGWVQLGATVGNNGSAFLWSNLAPVLGLQNTGLAANVFPTTDVIVAQDLQCSARILLNGNVTDSAVGEVGAMFAPRMHVRPDWSLQRFGGGETDGT